MNRSMFQQASLAFLNLPYIWGGDDPIIGYDCSGLAQELFAMVGLDPKGDQTAQGLFDHFKAQSGEGPRDTGTLLFFGHNSSSITHVAIMLDSETLIEAGGGGSKTHTAEDAAKQNAFIRLRPFGHRADLVAIVNPKGLPWTEPKMHQT